MVFFFNIIIIIITILLNPIAKRLVEFIGIKIFLKEIRLVLISTLKGPDLTEKGRGHSNLERMSVP